MLSMFTEVIWLAAGLAVLGSVVLFFLGPMYEEFKIHKHALDEEVELLTIIQDAIEKHKKTGEPVTLEIGSAKDETTETEN
jgi:hypothetical protein|tara:strand:+ start:29 stop:271 length:243 start_codon:yes stop_codon:yes gene_type:complete